MNIEKIKVYAEGDFADIHLITDLPEPDWIYDKLTLEFVIKREDVQEYLEKHFPNIPVIYILGD